MNFTKQLFKRISNSLGIEIHRFNSAASSLGLFMAALKTFEIDMILDVGANQGQYAQQLRIGGFTGDIISFEPLSDAYAVLDKKSKNDKRWTAFPRCAIGDSEDAITINISQNSVSSSVLPMLTSHLAAAPMSAYIGNEIVDVHKLDTLWPTLKPRGKSRLLKIDTQGFEWQVLDGAKEMLKDMSGVQIELSLLPLYKDQHLWRDCIDRLEAEGFTLWSLQSAFTDHGSGRTMQWDGLFFRQ